MQIHERVHGCEYIDDHHREAGNTDQAMTKPAASILSGQAQAQLHHLLCHICKKKDI